MSMPPVEGERISATRGRGSVITSRSVARCCQSRMRERLREQGTGRLLRCAPGDSSALLGMTVGVSETMARLLEVCGLMCQGRLIRRYCGNQACGSGCGSLVGSG